MKNLIFKCVMLFVIAGSISCSSFDKGPEEVFYTIIAGTNQVPNGFKRHFNEIRSQLKAGNLLIVTPENKTKKVNALEYVNNHYLKMFDKEVAEIKKLPKDEETKPIIDASLDVIADAQKIYIEDFPKIAKMIDNNLPDETIDEAILLLDETKGVALDEKYNKAMDLLIPYAKKHNVKYDVLKTPF